MAELKTARMKIANVRLDAEQLKTIQFKVGDAKLYGPLPEKI